MAIYTVPVTETPKNTANNGVSGTPEPETPPTATAIPPAVELERAALAAHAAGRTWLQFWAANWQPHLVAVARQCGQADYDQLVARLVEAGELTQRSHDAYVAVANRFASILGSGRLASDLEPADFELVRRTFAKSWGPNTLAVAIQRIRTMFRYGHDEGLLASLPRYGQSFRRPAAAVVRKARAAAGPRMYTPVQVKSLLDAADARLRAMVLLGINCGFGCADCATLVLRNVDWDGGWIRHPRPKTGIDRRCPLWSETVDALRLVLASRRHPRRGVSDQLVFVTPGGGSYTGVSTNVPVSQAFATLAKAAGVGGSFYWLRHTFRTVADDALDQPAVDLIMGHAPTGIASVYRERITDARLTRVVEVVYDWLGLGSSPPVQPGTSLAP